MKKILALITFTLIMMFSIQSRAEGITITSAERSDRRHVRVYFIPKKNAKRYQVEYFWTLKNGRNLDGKSKIVKAQKVRKDKHGRYYIQIPAKNSTQYVCISYRKKDQKNSRWRAWSGYKKVICHHGWKTVSRLSSISPDGVVETSVKKMCRKCGTIKEIR